MSGRKSLRLEKFPDSAKKEAYREGVYDSTPLSDRRCGYLSQWWSPELLERQVSGRMVRV